MSEFYNIVPWYSCKEWHNVYDLLYSTNSSSKDKLEALNLLLMWKVRCPSLPSGIESTLTLLEVHIQDSNTSDDSITDQFLRLAYSSAIMRFVNHMLDTETVKGTSLYQAAKTLGVPDWIIDLRHNTAHSNSLPSLGLLREACIIGLDWLKQNYWDKHKLYIKDYLSGQNYGNNENKIEALMNFCVSLSFIAQPNCNIKNVAAIPDTRLKESIVNDIQELFGDTIDLSNLKTVSVSSLILLLNIQAKKLFKSKDSILHVNKALLGEESLFLSSELAHFMGSGDVKKYKKLKPKYVQCFEVLLTFLHTNDLLLDFILELIKITQDSDNNDYKCRLTALWISDILAALNRSMQFLEKTKKSDRDEMRLRNRGELKFLYHHWFPNIKTNVLLLDLLKPVPTELTNINYIQPIITRYNPYLTYFLKNLLNLIEPQLPQAVEQKICELAQLISSPEKFSSASATRIYTVDDLELNPEDCIESKSDSDCYEIPDKSIETNNQNKVRCVNIKNSIWRLASSEHDWSTCPIGRLPWQQSDDVEIQEDVLLK